MPTARATVVFGTDDLHIFDVRCGRAAGHVDEESTHRFEVVLPTSGAFRRRATHGDAVIDPGCGYVSPPGTTQELAHITPGDRCIALLPTDRLADELGLDRMAPTGRWAVPVSRRVHRQLAAALATDAADVQAVEERWVLVLAAVTDETPRDTPTAGQRQQLRAVDHVREAVAANPGAAWTMRGLAEIAGYAPHHLSRVFRRHASMSLSEYRDRIRLGRAIELVRDGMALADVAAATAFCDHAHLTRRSKQVLGVVPSSLARR